MTASRCTETKPKPGMTATFDGKGHVLLEIDEKKYLSSRSKAYRTFKAETSLVLGRAGATLRKRVGAKRFGHYLPMFKFSEVEKEIRELYTVNVQTDSSLELEEDLIDEITNSWPEEEDFSGERPPPEDEEGYE